MINQLPEIVKLGINAVKIEGRMRTPYYVATTTEIYRKAIDSFYEGRFNVSKEMLNRLQSAFSREFTTGWFNSQEVFNWDKAGGESLMKAKEFYNVKTKEIRIERNKINLKLPEIKKEKSKGKQLLVRVYNKMDALKAAHSGADIVYLDLFDNDFNSIIPSGL